ncbi:hypothetical protein AARAC_001921 [Aspergillus arachidicola]|uniref:Uncharacterized protein n=1 Tax=Aspergillus arachidicola TaxID=656916 RepID=A0A2G7GB99_9EURO|nr:hypothetical protein AARAC_001921 [Aspergillus arachidicola]
MTTTTDPPNYTLFDALIDWGNANTDQIREAHLSKGGWEGWAQEEMRMLFNAGREDNCYLNTPAKPPISKSLLRRGCNVYCIALAMSNEGACKMEKLGLELFEGGTLEAPFQVWWFMRRFEAENWSADSDDDGDERDEEDDGDEVDFDSSEVESGEDEDGYDIEHDNGHGNEYHGGQGGWDYNYS